MITFSIVVYKNNAVLLEKCLNSLLSYDNDFTLYIVDNSPTDELREIVDYPTVQYCYNNKNIGYGAGHNIAIRRAIEQKSEYHFILNPDVYFDKGEIDSMLGFMRSKPEVGLLMPKVVYPDGHLQNLCKLLPSPLDLFGRRFLYFTPWAKNRKRTYELQQLDYNKIYYDIPCLSGCFMLFRTPTLETIGGFDERYFMYLEDVDISRRTLEVTHNVFFPQSQIVHSYEKGSYKSLKLLKYHIVSTLIYFNKWGYLFDRERKMFNKKFLDRNS